MRYILILLTTTLIYCSHDKSLSTTPKSVGDYKEESEPEMIESKKQTTLMQIEEDGESAENLTSKITNQIIKTGYLNFEVDSIKKAKLKVDQILDSVNGYYENEQFHSYGQRNKYQLKIRIPNDRFDTFIDLLEADTGNLLSKNISAKDVTEEFVDINIRLESNLAYLNQYKEILKKAKTIEEILEVQERIRYISTEIDSKKGRLKYLADQVKYSTLSVELTQKVVYKKPSNPFFSRIANAFENGFNGFLNFLVLIVNLWPFIILGLLIWFSRKRILRKFKTNNSKNN